METHKRIEEIIQGHSSLFVTESLFRKAAYEHLVEQGEIDKETVYNIGSKDQSQPPRQYDIGIKNGKLCTYRDGVWS